jgi:predicted ester cyclase
MSEANKLLLRRWFEQVWNQKSEAAIDQMFGKDGKSHGFPDADSLLVGPEAFKAVHRVFCGAFPDLHVEVEDVVAEGDRVAVRWRVTMTHMGDHLGFPARGRKGTLDGSSFLIVKDNQVIEGWNQMDLQALMQKLQGS